MEVNGTITYAGQNGTIQFDCETGSVLSAEKSITSIVIPERIDGVAVVNIANRAFMSCKQLESVILPSTLTKIGYRAFRDCTGLKQITIPKSVAETGREVALSQYSGRWFEGCSSLVRIILEDGITTIPVGAYAGIPTDVNINIPESVTAIKDEAFCGSKITRLYLPDSVREIGAKALSGTMFTKVVPSGHISEGIAGVFTLPDSVERTGTGLFRGCREMKEIIWPETLSVMPNQAFYDCSKLENIKLPVNLTSIGYQAFKNCIVLERVTIPKAVNQTGRETALTEYSGRWFEGCSKLVQVVVEDGATVIPEGAYAGISADVKITIPVSIVSVGAQAFQGTAMTSLGNILVNIAKKENIGEVTIGVSVFRNCSKLKRVEWPEDLPILSNWIFENCTALETLVLPSGVTSIGYRAFKGCTGLESVTIPKTVNQTGREVALAQYSGRWFEGCSKLTRIVIEDGATVIPNGAYAGIPTDVDIDIPESVIAIKDEVFFASKITRLNLSEFVQEIGHKALSKTMFTRVVPRGHALEGTAGVFTIPDSSEKLGVGLFRECSVMKEIIWPESKPVMPNEAFNGCSQLDLIELPVTLTSIGYLAFKNCTSLERVTIPKSVNQTGYETALVQYSGRWFSGCSKLIQIIIEDGTTAVPNGAYAGIPTDVDIAIPGSILSIGAEAFAGTAMTSLRADFANVADMEAPESVTAGTGVFKNCKQLKTVEWPEFISILPNDAFQNCTALETVVLPLGIKSIGYRAFKGCTSLESIEIPRTVEQTGRETALAQYSGRWFDGSGKLVEVKLEEGMSKIPTGAFAGISTDFAITIPESVKEIEAHAFYNCSKLTSITLPAGIEKVGTDAFKGCNNLTIIYA